MEEKAKLRKVPIQDDTIESAEKLLEEFKIGRATQPIAYTQAGIDQLNALNSELYKLARTAIKNYTGIADASITLYERSIIPQEIPEGQKSVSPRLESYLVYTVVASNPNTRDDEGRISNRGFQQALLRTRGYSRFNIHRQELVPIGGILVEEALTSDESIRYSPYGSRWFAHSLRDPEAHKEPRERHITALKELYNIETIDERIEKAKDKE